MSDTVQLALIAMIGVTAQAFIVAGGLAVKEYLDRQRADDAKADAKAAALQAQLDSAAAAKAAKDDAAATLAMKETLAQHAVTTGAQLAVIGDTVAAIAEAKLP